MIRRGFWLALGAAVGIAGYRRAARFTRSFSPGLRAAGLARFASDVREGMEQYRERHPGRDASTLGSHRGGEQIPGPPAGRVVSTTNHVKDGR